MMGVVEFGVLLLLAVILYTGVRIRERMDKQNEILADTNSEIRRMTRKQISNDEPLHQNLHDIYETINELPDTIGRRTANNLGYNAAHTFESDVKDIKESLKDLKKSLDFIQDNINR